MEKNTARCCAPSARHAEEQESRPLPILFLLHFFERFLCTPHRRVSYDQSTLALRGRSGILPCLHGYLLSVCHIHRSKPLYSSLSNSSTEPDLGVWRPHLLFAPTDDLPFP